MRLSPYQSRLLYDILVLGVSGILVLAFTIALSGVLFRELLLLPLIALGAFFTLGVYGRNRAASFGKKTFLLSVGLLISVVLGISIKIPIVPSLLWSTLAWGPLVLPRIFLGINPRPRLGRFTNSVNEIIKQSGPVLVVGGAGYIGSHVVGQLLANHKSVRVLDRFFYGQESLRELSDAYPGRLEIIEGDVTNISRLVSAARGCSAIVHLAGIVGDSACRLDEKTALHCNIVATRMLYEVARSFGVPRFIFASSCSVYGNNPKTVDENSPLNPISLYAETKIESERQLLSAIDDYFIVTILRFATVFGDSRRPRFDLVANLFAAQAFTTGRISVFGGSQRRPFIHAADVARAVLLTLNTKPSTVQGQIYNIGDGNLNATIAELAQLVAKAVEKIRPVEIDLVEGCEDLRDYNVSFQKVKDHLGFEASISLEQGIEEIVRNLSEGKYGDYTSARYNNLEVTKKVLLDQQDPQQSGMLYAPINTYDNE